MSVPRGRRELTEENVYLFERRNTSSCLTWGVSVLGFVGERISREKSPFRYEGKETTN